MQVCATTLIQPLPVHTGISISPLPGAVAGQAMAVNGERAPIGFSVTKAERSFSPFPW